jgi:hypothetical protein
MTKKLRTTWNVELEQDMKYVEQLRHEEENPSDVCSWTGEPHDFQ